MNIFHFHCHVHDDFMSHSVLAMSIVTDLVEMRNDECESIGGVFSLFLSLCRPRLHSKVRVRERQDLEAQQIRR